MTSTNEINKHIPLNNTAGQAQPVASASEPPTLESVQSLIAAMSPPLKEHYQAIRTYLADTTKYDAQVRYAVGARVAEIEVAQENLYGAGAVETLAAALGLDKSTLYRAARVARAWSLADFNSLLERKTVHGRPISWSHVAELSAVSSKVACDALVERVFTNGLSVRETVAAREELPPLPQSPVLQSVTTTARPNPSVVKPPVKTSAGSLRKMVKLSESLAERAANLDANVFQSAVPEGSPPPAKTVKLLEQARVATEGLVAAAEDMLAKINAALSKVGESPTATRSKIVATSQLSSVTAGLGKALPMA